MNNQDQAARAVGSVVSKNKTTLRRHNERAGPLVTALLFVALIAHQAGIADVPTLAVVEGGAVQILVDQNGDEDYFDFAEVRLFADNLPASISDAAVVGTAVFVLDGNRSVIRLADQNGDGDALDFAEVSAFAELPDAQPAPTLAGLAAAADGSLYSVDSASGILYRFADANAAGDALDAGDWAAVAVGLSAAVSLSVRPDGVVLVGQSAFDVPVRILHDRNGDGDFLDFAENLSYAENAAPGRSIAAVTDRLSFLLRPADGEILRLEDRTGDDDVLDFAEVLTFATGITAGQVIAPAADGALFVGCGGESGAVLHVVDRNGDQDALDFAETLTVAEGLSPVRGLAVMSAAAGCIPGDVNADGAVGSGDVGGFAAALAGQAPGLEPCRGDVNADGTVDARDIQPFVEQVISPQRASAASQ